MEARTVASCSKRNKSLPSTVSSPAGAFHESAIAVGQGDEVYKQTLALDVGEADTILGSMPDREIKIFLSHATKDKPTLVQGLYTALNDKFDVWYDDKSLIAGESIPFGISDGAKACAWAVAEVRGNPTTLPR